MKVSTFSNVIYIAYILLLLVLGTMVFRILAIQEQLSEKSGEFLLDSYHIADELRQSSEDLTRMARSYVATGNPLYKQHFFEILDIRNGTAPRPIPYGPAFWYTEVTADGQITAQRGAATSLKTKMQQLGLTEDELKLLGIAQRRSDILVETELEAFATLETAGQENPPSTSNDGKALALEMLFNEEFQRAKRDIMVPISTFSNKVEQRINDEVNRLHEMQFWYILTTIAIIILALFAAMFMISYSRNIIIAPLKSLTTTARDLAAGRYAMRSAVYLDNELGTLGRSLNTMADAIQAEMAKLKILATTDPLTSIANRRAFMERMESEMHRACRYGDPLTVLMIDIDHFKQFNDNFGHHVGDEVLKQVCNTCKANVRDIDIIGRIGGEEIAVLLPGTRVKTAASAERIRRAVEATEFEHGTERLGVTVSIGASQQVGKESIESLLGRADKAMYLSKSGGRNRVTIL